jgi:hypothetical protein
MKTMVRILLGTSVLAASVAAHAAQTTLPNTDNSNLLFYVSDVSNKSTYTLVLKGQDINGASGYFTTADALTSTTLGVVNTINGDANFSYNLGTDAALQSFITTANGNSDTLEYGLISGGYVAGNLDVQGNSLIITSAVDASKVINVADTATSGGVATKLNTDVNALNQQTFDSFAVAPGTKKGIFGTSASSSANLLTLYGTGVNQPNVFGSPSQLYGLTPNGSGGGVSVAFDLGTLAFDGTTLSFTGNSGNSAVPLPAAAWLFGSGLLGLLGIGRRRNDGSIAGAAA